MSGLHCVGGQSREGASHVGLTPSLVHTPCNDAQCMALESASQLVLGGGVVEFVVLNVPPGDHFDMLSIGPE